MSASCPVCLQNRTVFFGQGADYLFETTDETFSLQSCSDCHCLFLDPMPGPEKIASFYPPSYWWDGSRPGFLRKLEGVYRRLALFDHVSFIGRAARKSVAAGERPRILDVGCGPGTVLSLLKARGFEVYGLDASAEASDIAKKEHGIEVTVGALNDSTFNNDTFDTVVLLHTLEHVRNPHQVLAQARRVLRPSGRLVLQVPNVDSIQCRVFGARWYGLDVPRHLIDYSRVSLLGLLEASGFKVEHVRHFNFRDNAPALASSLFPSLDPVSRAVRRRSSSAESRVGTWLRHLAYLSTVLLSYPPAVLEAAMGRGATLMVQARKK
jgi:2-polyprenyl-3-methyl-5-hydroxy-6-metoxy-1,4-benzoquinol methylase